MLVPDPIFPQLRHVQLDDVSNLEHGIPLMLVDEVVQHHQKTLLPPLPQGIDQRLVHLLVFQQLQAKAVRVQRQRPVAHHMLPTQVDEGALLTDELLHADFYETVDQQLRGGELMVNHLRGSREASLR